MLLLPQLIDFLWLLGSPDITRRAPGHVVPPFYAPDSSSATSSCNSSTPSSPAVGLAHSANASSPVHFPRTHDCGGSYSVETQFHFPGCLFKSQ